MFRSHCIIAATAALSLSLSIAHATPNGKPFVELDGQLHEVQGAVQSLQQQLDALVARVDTIEEQVGANQDAIAALTATNADLQAQIDAGADDVADLQARMAHNEMLITALRDRITAIELVLADASRNEEGMCPEGFTLLHHTAATGQTACQPNGWPQEAGLYTYLTVRIAPRRTSHFVIGCPDEVGFRRLASDVTVDQTGDLQLLGVSRLSYYHYRVGLTNPTNSWQVSNLSLYCASQQ